MHWRSAGYCLQPDPYCLNEVVKRMTTANQTGAPLLEMRNVKKDFFGNQVLTDINLTLEAGQVLGLVGENGAGKSTLMKILFGMDEIRETGGYGGDILLNGEKVNFSSPFDALAKGIGMVHQEFSLIPGFTATENILLNREPKKENVISLVFGDRLNTLERKKMDEQSKAAIEKMGVRIDENMLISNMPVGHKQFTEIARELSKEQLQLLINEMEQGQRDYENISREGTRVTIGRITSYNRFFAWKREQIEIQRDIILHTREERQKKLKALMEVMTYLKSIEQLKEKRLREYNEQVMFEEQKFLDELGLQLTMRARREAAS